MLVSVAIGALPGYPIQSAMALVRNAGADGVEVMLSPRSAQTSGARVALVSEQVGIPVLSVHAALRLRHVGLTVKTQDDLASLRFAGGVPTCRVLVLHPPLTGPRPSADLERWLDAVVNERERTSPSLRLALENRAENHDGTPPQFLDDLERLRTIAGEWGVDVTLDLAHAASFGVDLVEAVQVVLPRLANVHLSDAFERSLRGGLRNGLFRDHRVPGTGILPLAAVLDRLSGNEYKGLVTLELSPVSLRAWWPGRAARLLRTAVGTVRASIPPARGMSSGVATRRHTR